jgi:nicotinate-nucleotide--dimethylbenzimidazole phosphoribosyltransferase
MVSSVVDAQSLTERRAALARVLATISGADAASMMSARQRLDQLTKPVGSLGRLEDLAARVCGMQRTLRPSASRRLVVVCAGDHGVAAEGVSAYPQAVTGEMVANFARGGAAVNALAAEAHAGVWIVDVGVAAGDSSRSEVWPNGAMVLAKRVRAGTRNMTSEPAMTEQEMLQALLIGVDVARRAREERFEVIGLGEMGIGNTTSASALTAALTGAPVPTITGRGTGIDDLGWCRKVSAVERALRLHRINRDRPLDALRTVGGLEIAALCGVCLGAAAAHAIIVSDGFIATAAALVATALCPSVRDYLVAGHLSPEPGHAVLLERLGLHPLLQLDMRLGEGSGAAIAMHVIGAACAMFNEMATFATAGVSARTP